MKKILNVVSSLNSGGVESMLYNYYSNFDKNYFLFDFAVYDKNIGLIEKKLLAIGANIYHITPRKESLIRNLSDLHKVIKNGKYDIVYSHMNFISWIALSFAFFSGTKVRISHSHSNSNKANKISIIKNVNHLLNRMLIKVFATNLFACSLEAGKFVYGNKWKENNSINRIIKNAIDISKFKFDESLRNKYRTEYCLNNKICLLHIGRFSIEKNHNYLIELMKRLDKDRFVLFCIGDGKELNNIINKANNNDIKNIVFLGSRNDVNAFYSMADVFLLPSLHEGLGIVLIEAQASGLKCIASNNIPKEVKINSNFEFINLDNINDWVKSINNCSVNYKRLNAIDKLKSNGYDINTESKKFETLLYSLLNKEK